MKVKGKIEDYMKRIGGNIVKILQHYKHVPTLTIGTAAILYTNDGMQDFFFRLNMIIPGWNLIYDMITHWFSTYAVEVCHGNFSEGLDTYNFLLSLLHGIQFSVCLNSLMNDMNRKKIIESQINEKKKIIKYDNSVLTFVLKICKNQSSLFSFILFSCSSQFCKRVKDVIADSTPIKFSGLCKRIKPVS